MKFDNLKEKCEYYRNLNDTRLVPNSYVMVMCDGRAFSKGIKTRFKKPFDEDFIQIMNETAEYICANVQGCKMAYTQSDEISIIITDFEDINSDSFFGFRNCKLLSIISSLATAKFNQLMTKYLFNKRFDKYQEFSIDEISNFIDNINLYQFDCKCWNIPSYNDVFSWFLYRQIDCVRNSKQQAAQTYLSHKELLGNDTDSQIKMLKEKKGIDWHSDYNDGMKYGRFIYKEKEHFISAKYGEYDRSIWKSHFAFPLMEEGGKQRFINLNVIPKS